MAAGDWTEEEQRHLEEGLVQAASLTDQKEKWKAVAKVVGTRNARACAERFRHCRELALQEQGQQIPMAHNAEAEAEQDEEMRKKAEKEAVQEGLEEKPCADGGADEANVEPEMDEKERRQAEVRREIEANREKLRRRHEEEERRKAKIEEQARTNKAAIAAQNTRNRKAADCEPGKGRGRKGNPDFYGTGSKGVNAQGSAKQAGKGNMDPQKAKGKQQDQHGKWGADSERVAKGDASPQKAGKGTDPRLEGSSPYSAATGKGGPMLQQPVDKVWPQLSGSKVRAEVPSAPSPSSPDYKGWGQKPKPSSRDSWEALVPPKRQPARPPSPPREVPDSWDD